MGSDIKQKNAGLKSAPIEEKASTESSAPAAKSGKMKFIVIGAVLLVIILIIIAALLLIPGSPISIAGAPIAKLNIQTGSVQVDTGNGFVVATDGMSLSIGDKVKTLSDGLAALVIRDTTIIMLDPDTEITLQDLDKESLKIYQSAGKTLNKFSGIVGVDGLTVETPNTVATVRGTEFEVTMNSVTVIEGQVHVVLEGTEFVLDELEIAIIENGVPIKREMTSEEKVAVSESIVNYVGVLKDERQEEIEKSRALIDMAKQTYGFDESQINDFIASVDRGEVSIEELDKLAIENGIDKVVDYSKVKQLTTNIVEANQTIETLN